MEIIETIYSIGVGVFLLFVGYYAYLGMQPEVKNPTKKEIEKADVLHKLNRFNKFKKL